MKACASVDGTWHGMALKPLICEVYLRQVTSKRGRKYGLKVTGFEDTEEQGKWGFG